MNEHTDWDQLGPFFKLVFIVMFIGTALVLAVEAFWLAWATFIGSPPPLSGLLGG